MWIKKCVLALVCCLSLSLMAQDEAPALFDLYSPDPVIEHGPRGEWDGRYSDPGAVIYHDGLFHMFRNGFKGWPASVEIGYLTSEDGFTWTEVTSDPVIRSADVPLTKLAALASSVIVEDDGTWVLYFYTWNTYNARQGEGAIGRATADNPAGPWTIDETLVLMPGEAGSWDDLQVDSPNVVKTDEGYLMFYAGRSTDQNPLNWAGHK